MGNLCGKQSSRDDYFTLPGRTLGSASSGAGGGGGGGGGVSAQRAGLPKASTGGTYVYGQGQAQEQGQAPRSRQSQSQSLNQGRTIGSGAASGNAANSPREAAARAAEERAKRSQGDGKLGKQLDAQKRQTVNATLGQVSRENRAMRDADAAAETRQWR